MNGYERISAVLNGDSPDKVPLMLHCFMAAAAEANLTQEEYRNSPQKQADAQLAFVRKYNLDGFLLDIDTCMEAYAIGVPVDFPKNEPARVTGPASTNVHELIEMMDAGKLHKNERIQISLETVNLLKNKVGGELFIRGNCDQMAFSLAMLAYGMEDFMADLLDEDVEKDIFTLMDRAYEVHLEYSRLMLEAGADIVSFGDSSCGPDLISRDMYLKYSHPYHKRLQKDISDMGGRTICHICGNLDLILPDVANVGFSGIEMDYKTNMPRAAQLLNNHSVAFGPIDPSSVFYYGTPQQVEENVKMVLDSFNGHNIVLGAGCALPPGVPEENIRAFVGTARAYTL